MTSKQSNGPSTSHRRAVTPEEDDISDTHSPVPIHALFAFPAHPSPMITAVSEHVHARAVSLPPLSSDGLIATSPIVGNRTQRTAKAQKKGGKKRAATIVQKRETEEATAQQHTLDAEKAKQKALDDVLALLTSKGLSWGDLMTHVFDPTFMQGAHRWDGFFKSHGSASRILDHWISLQNSTTARIEVHEWAVNHIAQTINAEAKAINEEGFLRSEKKELKVQNILGFSMMGLQTRLRETAGVAMRMFDAFATSSRHLRGGIGEAR